MRLAYTAILDQMMLLSQETSESSETDKTETTRHDSAESQTPNRCLSTVSKEELFTRVD